MSGGMIGTGGGGFKTTNQGKTSSSGGTGKIINAAAGGSISSSGGSGKMINAAGNRP
jgi:hypothetical protein